MKNKKLHIFIFAVLALAVESYFLLSTNSKVYPLIKNNKKNDKTNIASTEAKVVVTSKTNEPTVAIDDVKFKSDAALKMGAKKIRMPSQVAPSNNLKSVDLLNGTRWKLWKNKKAVLQSTGYTTYAKVSNYFIVDDLSNKDPIGEFSVNEPTVVFNERLKKPGVLTGTVKVVTTNRTQLEDDLRHLNASISDSFEHIQTYFIASHQSIFNIELLYTNLKSLNYVTDIELEILSRDYDKN